MFLPRLLKVVVSAVSVAVTTMAQLNLPNAEFWAALRPVLYLAVAGLVVAATELIGITVDRLQHRRST